jgi:hypothetical protein
MCCLRDCKWQQDACMYMHDVGCACSLPSGLYSEADFNETSTLDKEPYWVSKVWGGGGSGSRCSSSCQGGIGSAYAVLETLCSQQGALEAAHRGGHVQASHELYKLLPAVMQGCSGWYHTGMQWLVS